MKKQLLILASIFCIHIGYSQTTFTVTSTAKDGPGSINEAIGFANSTAGVDIIEFTPGLQINATHPFYIPGGQTDYMLNITESVTIDGKGGALIGSQRWINPSGEWNSLDECPGNVPNGNILARMPNFMQVGIIDVDNAAITVTVKNLSIEQFNSIAKVRDNATLEFENFNADKIWSTLFCNSRGLLSADAGASISIKNSQFINTVNWGDPATTSEISSSNAGDLTIENTLFYNNNGGEQFAISWDGASGSEVNIVSSRFMLSGGIFLSGSISVSNFVNSIWVNKDTENPESGDRIINSASGDMNITASSLMWNNNYCDGLCQSQLSESLIERRGAGKINFKESAIGLNNTSGLATLLNTLGNTGTGAGFSADTETWIQPTTNQDVAALRAITFQPVLRSNGTAFNSPVVPSTLYFDAEMVTPAFPGELIDIIPAASVLTNPINSTPITMDVFGNARNDANGLRDIGAFQLGLASALSLGTITDGSVGLSWTEPLHHAGIAILNYRITYSEVGGFGDFVDVPSINLTTTITGLTNGVEYEFSVQAIYGAMLPGDLGPPSNTVSATPFGTMTAPAVTATPGNTEVALSWNVSDLGGRTFQQYNILWYEQVSGNFVDFHQVFDPNEITYTVTGLTNGTTYDFIITARASEDTSPSGTASATPDALPIALCQPFTAELDANGTVTINPSDVDGGSSDPDGGSVTLSLDNDTFTCADIGPNTVTLTVTNNDSPNSTATCTAVVTVEDTLPAVIGCPGDITATTEDGDCGAIVNFQNAIAIDNCGSTIVSQTAGFASGSVFPVGDTLIEFTAQDDNGNLSTCTFTITVEDDDAPDAICQNITVQLDDMGNATITAGQINFGSSDNCGVDTLDLDIDTFDCSNVGENTVILTVTDVNGNASTCMSIVTVEDVTAPEVVCNDITVQLDANGSVTIDPMDVGAGSSDACGIATYELNIDTFSCLDVGNSTVILTVTDVNGNQSSCSATVTVEDNTAPVLVCMDVTLELNEDGVAFITPALVADIIDNCGTGVVTIDVDEVSCADIGTPLTVNVFANDGNGNSSFCSATVTVVDTLGPQIVCPPNETVNLDPNGTYTLGDYIGDGIATVSDNCTDPVTIFSQDPAAGTLLGFGVQVITFTAEDEYGNVSTCSFDLDVQGILGSNDLELGSLILYPNPTDNYVNLSNPNHLELYDVSIYDVTGRLINKIDLSNMGEEVKIDVSNFASATYMLIINGAKGVTTKQLIVE